MPVDFFARGALPAPRVSATEAERLAADLFGVVATAQPLGSQQDANFLLRGDNGTAVVLKIANPAFGAAEIEAQDQAAALIGAAYPELRTATVQGDPAAVRLAEGPIVARLLRFLPGGTLSGSRYLSPRSVAAMGRIAGQVGVALRDFEHDGLRRVLQWDLRNADRLVDLLLPHVHEAPARDAVRAATAAAWARVSRVADVLPRQAVHLDLTDDNLVCAPAVRPPAPDGVIDFGDLTTTWAVSELAVTLSSMLHHDGVQPCDLLPAVRAFHAVRPLSVPEAAALWPLVVLRAAGLVVSGRQQAAIDGDNAYVEEALDREWRIFEQATAVPSVVMTRLVEAAAGLPATPIAVPAPAAPLVRGEVAVLDLGPDADALDGGAWLEPGVEDRLAAELLAGGAAAVATRYAQARLTAAPALSAEAPATVPTGIDLWLAEGTALPTFGDYGPCVLTVDRHGTRVHLGLRLRDAPDVPALVRPEYAAGWLALTADPSPLLGLPVPAADPEADLLARREAVFADVQEHYYADPPRIERGWRHHLVSTDARSYLDIVNNVTPLGHAHPGLERAIARQLRKLNTNSRFHYAAVVELAERLAGLLPEPLDTVFLVNSGSEAVDLAIRLAIGATGHHDVVAMREAYHGWTYASDAVSTSLQDNPNALATRPAWVHTVDSPNSYRGRYRGAQAARYGLEAAAALDNMAAAGHSAGAFLSETVYGNAGGVTLPDGYLAQVYAAVRRHGGLAIGDEIQVGYGRLGHWFWGFEQQGVVPDIVCVAKAMGNGHPLGAVITSRAVAGRYHDQGYFFSSTGGSPVSSVAGLAVLDALRDEDLQGNAARVGRHLKTRLQDLAARHAIVGTVHGSGLYLGLELIRDHATLEPATEETAELCDRLLGLGVVVQPTGDQLNILKIKPPLCIDTAAADFFADQVEQALNQLGYGS